MTEAQGPANQRGHPPWDFAGALGLTSEEVAEALWLAARIDGSEDFPASPPTPPVEPDHQTSVVAEPDPPPPPPDRAPAEPPEPTPARTPDVPQPAVRQVPAPPEPTALTQVPVASPPARPAAPVRALRAGLPHARAIARGLRPLKQLIDSPHRQVLDETATAERAADDPLWWPVLRPAAELRWDAVVVVDGHASMDIWREPVSELVSLLRRQGAFRDVQVRKLATDGKDPGEVVLRSPEGTGPAAGPGSLLVPTGRRIVLLVTDGAGPAWETDAVLPALWTWAAGMPVVVLHLLAQQQWHRTGIRPQRARLRAAAPGTANARLIWEPAEPAPAPAVPAGAVPVPVLELGRPGWLAVWAKLVAGLRSGWTSLPVLLATPSPAATAMPETDPAMDARQRVQEFTAWATPTARTLATHLAAAPLNLPVMRRLQRQLLPTSDASHLSEVLYSGLLRPVASGAAVSEADRVTFEFERGVREELLAAGRRSDTVRVLRIVEEYLGPRVPAVAGLSRVIDDPDSAPARAVTAETAPFVRAEQAALRALSGPYLPRSRELDGALTTYNPSVTVSKTSSHERSGGETEQSGSSGEGVGVTTSTDAPASSVQTADAAPPKAPDIWGNVPPRNPNFTGRESLLDALHAQMRGGTTAVLPHALHGMGGVGKSALAVEYVYRHQGDYDLIWWVPAERTTQIGAALVELAQRMRLDAGMEAITAVPAVREALRLGKPYANWLLVFDNAESPESVRDFFPTGGPGSIMVTSRNPHWANTATPLEVDVFTRQESIDLLRRRDPELAPAIGEQTDEQQLAAMTDRLDQLDRLAEALGDLPLALEQAAAWRAETGMTIDEYLRLLEEKRVELLEASPPVDYQLPVAAAWNLSLDRLVVSNPAALRLLQVCAFLASEPIPRTLLAGARHSDIHPELDAALRDPMRLNRAIRDVNRYALARIDYRINAIQMHRLIQAVLVDRMPESERVAMRRSSHLLLASADRNDPVSVANWRQYAELLPHVMASDAVNSTDPWVVQLVDNEARYLYWWGDHAAARDLSKLAYDARRENLGAGASETLRIGRWLSFMYFVQGMYTEAAELNQRLLVDHRRHSSEDSEDLLDLTQSIAADRRVAGDFAEALAIDEDLHGRYVRALGPDDPETLRAAHNLALSIRLCGDFNRALRIGEETLRQKVDLFGEDHPITLETARNVVIDRRELGEYVKARSDQQEVVDRLRQVVVEGHPQLLRAQRSLSATLRKAGQHEDALALSRRVYDGFLSRYGADHPDTLGAATNLLIDLRQAGELDEALAIGDQLLAGHRHLFGDDHPHTFAVLGNLAVAHRQRGDADVSQRMNEQVRAAFRERLGENHPLSLVSGVNLASDLFVQGEFEGARELDADMAERLAGVFGPNHPTTLACLGNLAIDLHALGRTEEAEAVQADAVARLAERLGHAHPATLVARELTVRANCDLDPMPL